MEHGHCGLDNNNQHSRLRIYTPSGTCTSMVTRPERLPSSATGVVSCFRLTSCSHLITTGRAANLVRLHLNCFEARSRHPVAVHMAWKSKSRGHKARLHRPPSPSVVSYLPTQQDTMDISSWEPTVSHVEPGAIYAGNPYSPFDVSGCPGLGLSNMPFRHGTPAQLATPPVCIKLPFSICPVKLTHLAI